MISVSEILRGGEIPLFAPMSKYSVGTVMFVACTMADVMPALRQAFVFRLRFERAGSHELVMHVPNERGHATEGCLAPNA